MVVGQARSIYTDCPIAKTPLRRRSINDDASVSSISKRILVVEDEQAISSFVRPYLEQSGYSVVIAESLSEARKAADATEPDLVILDLTLPDGDGFDALTHIRRASDAPVIILSARDDEKEKIIGLGLGADDYVTKPFHPDELVARVKAILRRSHPSAAKSADEVTAIRHGNLEIDSNRREVKLKGRLVQLAPKEFDLLFDLLKHKGVVVTRDELLQRVWGYQVAVHTRTVDVHVRQLRHKLGDDCPVITVWGIGYKASTEPTV